MADDWYTTTTMTTESHHPQCRHHCLHHRFTMKLKSLTTKKKSTVNSGVNHRSFGVTYTMRLPPVVRVAVDPPPAVNRVLLQRRERGNTNRHRPHRHRHLHPNGMIIITSRARGGRHLRVRVRALLNVVQRAPKRWSYHSNPSW